MACFSLIIKIRRIACIRVYISNELIGEPLSLVQQSFLPIVLML